MARPFLTAFLIVFLVAMTGCEGEPKQPLTAETAKRALLEMDFEIPSGVMAFPPTDEPVKPLSLDEVSIGAYRCNLKERTFYAFWRFPNADKHSYNDVHGIFEWDKSGKWIARIKGSSTAHYGNQSR